MLQLVNFSSFNSWFATICTLYLVNVFTVSSLQIPLVVFSEMLSVLDLIHTIDHIVLVVWFFVSVFESHSPLLLLALAHGKLR